MVGEEGRRNREMMRGVVLHSHGGRRGRVHRGRGDVKFYGVAAGPVGRKLASGPQEYQEGSPSLGQFREVNMEGGGGYFCFIYFYRTVVQTVLLFGAETWVLLATMTKNTEGVHMGFLRKVTGKTSR